MPSKNQRTHKPRFSFSRNLLQHATPSMAPEQPLPLLPPLTPLLFPLALAICPTLTRPLSPQVPDQCAVRGHRSVIRSGLPLFHIVRPVYGHYQPPRAGHTGRDGDCVCVVLLLASPAHRVCCVLWRKVRGEVGRCGRWAKCWWDGCKEHQSVGSSLACTMVSSWGCDSQLCNGSTAKPGGTSTRHAGCGCFLWGAG